MQSLCVSILIENCNNTWCSQLWIGGTVSGICASWKFCCFVSVCTRNFYVSSLSPDFSRTNISAINKMQQKTLCCCSLPAPLVQILPCPVWLWPQAPGKAAVEAGKQSSPSAFSALEPPQSQSEVSGGWERNYTLITFGPFFLLKARLAYLQTKLQISLGALKLVKLI